MEIEFTKMHGLGNDYLFIDATRRPLPEEQLPEIARRMSDRHFGVGSDGIILILPARAAHFRMRIFNSDGSEAEMCGNGIRCFAKYVYERGLTQERSLEVETGAGIIRPQLSVRGGKVHTVQVDMGAPRWRREEIPMKGRGAEVIEEKIRVAGERYEVTCLSMGNPHCVLFVPRVEQFPVAQVGPAIERHDLFPRRTNVEFIQVVNKHELRMRVWERGAGETLACGTGASAALAAAARTGRAERRATVHLVGGDLAVVWREADDHILITGPAEEVFTGRMTL